MSLMADATPLPTSSTKSILGTVDTFFRWSKQDAGHKAPNMREEEDAVGPPPEQESIHEAMMVSPTHAKEIMLDVPDRSAEDVVSIVNDLALNDVLKSSPKPKAPSKRKLKDTDAADGSSNKRVAKGTGVTEVRDQSATTSTNGITRHRGTTSHTFSEVVKAPSGKLLRPRKEQQKRHMVNSYSAVQRSNNLWSPPPTPKQQAEEAAIPPTTPTRKSLNPETTSLPKGRPRRVGLSSTERTTLTNKGQRKNTLKMKAQPGHKGRSEGDVSPDIEPGEVCEVIIENMPQKGGPKARQTSSKTKTKSGDDHKKQTPERRSTRSVASANGQKDIIMNANTDLTKKPERDARKAAKRETTVARKAQNNTNIRASAQRASPKVHNDVVSKSLKKRSRIVEEHEEEEEEKEEEEEAGSEREERIDSAEAVDKDGQRSSYVGEREEGGTEAEEQEPVTESSSAVLENDEEVEGQEEMELFGKEGEWKTILQGAQSVCGRDLLRNQMPKLLTETIKDLVGDVKKAREVYGQLLPLKGIEQDSIAGLNNDLSKSLHAIDLKITGLSEKNAGKKASKMIRDIYACAIPAMVFVLQCALKTRTYRSDASCDLETLSNIVIGLEEIIRLQKMAIELCEKARTWKAKPVPTSRPIIRPTTHEIYPNLRHMQKAFSITFDDQKKKRRVKENALRTAQKASREEERLRSSQQASQEAASLNDFRNRRILESIEKETKKRRSAKPSYRQLVQNEVQARTQSQQVNGRIEPSVHWSEDEDIELYIQLEKGYDPGLTTTERYLKMLNVRPLQNKLPEHIRDRALYVKPFLLEQKGALEWITSIT